MRRGPVKRLLVALLLSAIIVLLLSRALIGGEVLNPAYMVFTSSFYSAQAPQGYSGPSNQVLTDQVYQFAPWRHFAWSSIREGRVPLWNPYSYSGAPFLATGQSAVFYPINLLLDAILPFEYTFAWSAFLKLLIAGLSTFLLARRYRLARIPALISAASFMLCGYVIVWLGYPITNGAVWLPTLIYLAERLLAAQSKREILRELALLSLVVGVESSGGHFETVFDLAFILGLYYVLRWLQTARRSRDGVKVRLKQLLLPVGSLLLGTCLAGVQILPFLEWLPISLEAARRNADAFRFVPLHPGVVTEILSLPLLLLPNLFDNPTWGYSYWYLLFEYRIHDIGIYPVYNEMAIYVGVFTFILSVTALLRGGRTRRGLVLVWAIIGLVCLGRALHLPVFDWLNQLPLVQLSEPGRLRLGFALALCVLAGFGAQALLDPDAGTSAAARRVALKTGGIVLGFLLAVMIASNVAMPWLMEAIKADGRAQVARAYDEEQTRPTRSIKVAYQRVEQLAEGLPVAFNYRNAAMYAPIIWTAVGLLAVAVSGRRGTLARRLLGPTLLTLVAADLLYFARDYNPTIPVEYFYPTTDVASQIERDTGLYRTTALGTDALPPDVQMMYEFSDVRGRDFPTLWYREYLDLLPQRIEQSDKYGGLLASVDNPLLIALNLKYVVTSRSELLEPRSDYRSVEKSGNVYLGERANVVPRAYLVHEAVSVGNDAEAAEILKAQPQAILSRVVLQDSGAGAQPARPAPQLSTEDTLSVIAYEPSEALFKAATDRDGYLVISDASYPGWNAYLDGEPVRLYRANIAFRAVFVPAGEHLVRVRYEPVSVRLGIYLGGVSLVVIAAALGCSFLPGGKPLQ